MHKDMRWGYTGKAAPGQSSSSVWRWSLWRWSGRTKSLQWTRMPKYVWYRNKRFGGQLSFNFTELSLLHWYLIFRFHNQRTVFWVILENGAHVPKNAVGEIKQGLGRLFNRLKTMELLVDSNPWVKPGHAMFMIAQVKYNHYVSYGKWIINTRSYEIIRNDIFIELI